MIDQSTFDVGTFESLKAGNQVVQQNRKKMNIDEMEDIKDSMAEQIADQEEMN